MNKEVKNWRFQFGSYKLIVLSDGTFPVSKEFFFADTPIELIDHYPDQFDAPLNFLLIDTGEKKVLVDTGFGEDYLPTRGRLLQCLQHEGISTEDIDTVIITHAHMDHIGGVSQQGVSVFPEANYVIREEEWAYWMNKSESMEYQKLKSIKDQLVFVSSDLEIHPGICLQHAPGHTDGHLTVSIQSEGKRLVVASDILNDPCTLQHLSSHIAAEVDPDIGMQTRSSFLEEASRQNALLFVCHYPFPGLGYVKKRDTGWHWVRAKKEKERYLHDATR
ncbi:MBL fold metallo-hydrolase [Metabacillus halosaccharovorans]|uniref:MBL fold metallo-hydrolase n=1 Tax=Metabacillus halosaccharovorans TaxID=930124 RepID=A0ABT3DEL0_9BACI|nr:MBL fold metallo-hydrolase [Metabacillus halosaccharovorans]MCV9885510.1 MBL fold metallo-hydrolase [Metabacillus halosaccharovorans]